MYHLHSFHECLQDMGYKNEVGYQTFLYYNEADLRHVFMFLIEHLPTDSKQVRPSVAPCDKKSMLYREISRKIYEEMNAIWIPYCCKSSNKNQIGDFVYPGNIFTILLNTVSKAISINKKYIFRRSIHSCFYNRIKYRL